MKTQKTFGKVAKVYGSPCLLSVLGAPAAYNSVADAGPFTGCPFASMQIGWSQMRRTPDLQTRRCV